MIQFFQSARKVSHIQAEEANISHEANATANSRSQEAASVSERATNTCEKEDDADNSEDVHVFM